MGTLEDMEGGTGPKGSAKSLNLMRSTWYAPMLNALEQQRDKLARTNPGSFRMMQLNAAVYRVKLRMAYVAEHGFTETDYRIMGVIR